MEDQLSYVYGVVRPSPAVEGDALAAVRGVAGAPVTLVRHGDLAAAVSPVPRSDFSEAALRAHLEDLEWLEAVARAHHQVVETLGAHTTVLPLRLATVYLDDARVRDMLDERQRTLTGLLDRLADHVEWGVKVYADASPGATAPPPAGAARETDPGRAYLRQRRQQRHAREDAWSSAADAVRRIQEGAGDLAVAHARHRPQQGRLAGGSGENIANDAYLVPRERAEEFRERILRAAEGLAGVRVEVTGPWVPYSFAQVPQNADPQGATQP
ncbi:GvpL/GvpF family gas vesicle protein [Streptomyces chromofuscus]|uniref:GvpL/GvpF family gas vesicle protein n=1 Tax=Streptomyces chromofuscus TaxID=42881 RepID=A0A7M2TDR0_STRCW|nr:GvpL/GvpF family gas vesicle protein [Streptomyces chromofuscus]QOV46642.1 GvpL/GvpF family gas vesicle protein [Streptomyces chromofuscus]GGT08437.1 gas vesicle protein [Streptomyces chromofuscus]